MNIRDIIQSKGPRVFSMWPEHTLGDAINRCDENNIASIVITDHTGGVIGMVTDRLALRAISRRGPKALSEPVTNVMLKPAPTCRLDDTVTEIMYRMTQERVRHAVVLEQGRVAGIISIGDLVKAKLREAELESRVLRERALSHIAAE